MFDGDEEMLMRAGEAVLVAARVGLRAEIAEEGFAAIRSLTETSFSDAELAAAIAEAIADELICDPVRLSPGALQCRWTLELRKN